MGFARFVRRRIGAEIRFLATGEPPDYLHPEAVPPAVSVARGAVLCRDPLVVATESNSELKLGLASLWGAALEDRDVCFLIHQSWSMDHPRLAWEKVQQVRFYRRRQRRHRIALLANTDEEAERFLSFGAASIVANHNLCVDEAVFKPLANAVREFDAILNARLSPFKRHQLAAGIKSLALLYGRDRTLTDVEQDAYFKQIKSEFPAATFANEIDGNPWNNLPSVAVNEWLNKAHVGLCLSAEEGANFASIEYLLVGLPVVSTASRGGRDRFFDDADCLICEADPRRVAEAVETMRMRRIPPDWIRDRVLAQIKRERDLYKESLESLLARWWPGRAVMIDMAKIKAIHRERPLAEFVADLELDPAPTSNRGVVTMNRKGAGTR